MRFNSPEHLETWRESGRLPGIHTALAEFAVGHMRGSAPIDLGCSYGLLGYRIALAARAPLMVGVEADARVIAAAKEAGLVEAAKAAGVTMAFSQLRVTRQTLPDLAAIVTRYGVDALIARRVMPELWGSDLEGGVEFASVMAEAGVKEVFLEGRVMTPNAVNPLRSIAEEVNLLTGSFREVRRHGALSYLVRW